MLILTLSAAFAADLRLEATLHGTGGFGSVVAAGDVDGDGYADLLVGQPLLQAFSVHHGGSTGVSEVPALTYSSTKRDFAYTIAVADLDGNGFDDAVVGIPESDSLDVCLGSPYGLGPLTGMVGGYLEIGRTLGSAGDTNGDGLEDIVATGKFQPYWFAGASRGYLIGLPLALPMGATDGRIATTGIGDLDGDGYDDIAAAVPSWDSGHIAVFRGGRGDAPAESTWSVYEGDAHLFGMGLGAAGDVDADGYADFLALSTGATAWLVRGSPYGPRTPEVFAAQAGVDQSSVSGVGDLDGDGFAEVAVLWVDDADDGGTRRARLSVFRGSAEGLVGEPWFEAGPISMSYGGTTVGPAGDVDGDGLPEMYLGLGPLEEVRIYGSDGATDPGDTDPPGPGDTDGADTDEGVAVGGRGCTCETAHPSGAAGALLLGIVLLSARRRSGLRSRP